MRHTSMLRVAHEYLVLIYDKPTANRLKYRSRHLAALPQFVGNPVKNAGAIVGKDGTLIGSHYNLELENEALVRNFLKADVYAKEGVWDLDGATILPVLIATRDVKNM
jgi:uncharacterized protein YciI